jgi:hypothetical protein
MNCRSADSVRHNESVVQKVAAHAEVQRVRTNQRGPIGRRLLDRARPGPPSRRPQLPNPAGCTRIRPRWSRQAGRTLLSTPSAQGLLAMLTWVSRSPGRRSFRRSRGGRGAPARYLAVPQRVPTRRSAGRRGARQQRYRTPAPGAHRTGTAGVHRALRHPAGPRPGAHPRQPDLVSDQGRKGCEPRLSRWPADLPVLFGHTTDEARFFVRPTGPYGAPRTSTPA